MKPSRLRHTVAITAVGALLVLSMRPAWAELGGLPMQPPARDNLATVQVMSHAAATVDDGYSLRETTLGTGTIIREYISTNNTVFGIAWRGPVKPNVADLLGQYFSQYASGVSTTHAARGIRAPVSIDTDIFIVRVGGHMGSFIGRAWLPQLLPAGITGNDIQ
ncbi:DUF2844 domain-containing protein [Paraburkholderia guartelaensis]|uniref:DUF2844 domain-containing protein n=1 Tax=Paraburkholderia guartelaensis TaxID=2546446 RepID=UPI002AB7C5CB|nr:DUF2844 domain-containing protein [Paraburkholderia guartelaensis]